VILPIVREHGITYPSIFDDPSRSIVLDLRHRVAAVFLTALRVAELMPVVQRVAAEPPDAPPHGPASGAAP
jgi:hypothetical protein